MLRKLSKKLLLSKFALMFTDYFVYQGPEGLIYYSITNIDNGMGVSLYQGEKLLLQKPVPIGKEVLTYEAFRIDIEVTLLKVNHALYLNNTKLTTKKVKKKELRALLEGLNLHNDIHPVPVPPEPIQWTRIMVIVAIIGFGLLLAWLTEGSSKFWKIPSFLIIAFGYFQLWYPIVGKGPRALIDEQLHSRLSYLLALISAIATIVLIGYLINID